VCRLGLSDIFLEVQEIVIRTEVALLEAQEANGSAVVRELLDAQFRASEEWVQTRAGGIDWIKRFRYNKTLLARLGVEIQVSARSDLLVRDLVHMRNSIQKGHIDAGVIVVPDDRMQRFLVDRTPSYADAVRYIEREFPEACNFPIVLIAVEHDGPSDTPLPKKKTNTSEGMAIGESKAEYKARKAKTQQMDSAEAHTDPLQCH